MINVCITYKEKSFFLPTRSTRSIRGLKEQLILLGKVTLLERDSTLTIFTLKVIDVPSTFRNEDNEYVPRTPIDLGGRYRDTLTSLKARSLHDWKKRTYDSRTDIVEDNPKIKQAFRSF